MSFNIILQQHLKWKDFQTYLTSGEGGTVVEDVHGAARYIPVFPSARKDVLFKGPLWS